MGLRSKNLERLNGGHFDVAIIGGGINGAVSAAALAGRGVSVALIDRGDFASTTSQESSNMVWGGFKYLENYEIRLVHKLSRSRNQLMKAYPTAIRDLRFLATLDASAPFPSWLAGFGALAYWGLGSFRTGPPRYLTAQAVKETEPIVDVRSASGGIEYGDGYMMDNDSRFVWNFIRSALDLGAVAVNYTNLVASVRSLGDDNATGSDDGMDNSGAWRLEAIDAVGNESLKFSADVLVNAAGPLVDDLNRKLDVQTKNRVLYSKGIHLIVPQLTPNERTLAFFDDSQRLFYILPMANRSVIGTTDSRTTNPDEGVTDEDRHFLLEQINSRLVLDNPLTVDDIISERCGVRSLVMPDDGNDRAEIDWTTLSRKHKIETDKERRTISIFGGKLTDCLNVGDEIVEAASSLGVELSTPRRWYGEPDKESRTQFVAAAAKLGLDRSPSVEREETIAHVLWRRHGMAAHQALDAVTEDASLADEVIPDTDVLRAELPLFAEREMIVKPEDLLRRRTKLALIHPADYLQNAEGMAEIEAITKS